MLSLLRSVFAEFHQLEIRVSFNVAFCECRGHQPLLGEQWQLIGVMNRRGIGGLSMSQENSCKHAPLVPSHDLHIRSSDNDTPESTRSKFGGGHGIEYPF